MVHAVAPDHPSSRPNARPARGRCNVCIYWRRPVRATRSQWQAFDEHGRTVIVEHAQCRRHAPTASPSQGRELSEGRWPEVNATDWCGDYAPLADGALGRHSGSEPPNGMTTDPSPVEPGERQ